MAPFMGEGLSLGRDVPYAANYRGVPCTIGQARLSIIPFAAIMASLC